MEIIREYQSIIICAGLLLTIVVFGIVAYVKTKSLHIEKQILLKPFFRMGYVLCRRLQKKDQVLADLKTLREQDPEKNAVEEYYVEKIAIVFLIFSVGIVISMLVFISAKTSGLVSKNNEIIRGDYEGTSKEIHFNFSQNNHEPHEISLEVSNREYSIEELDMFSEELFGEILNIVLLENSSAEHIISDLYLPTQLDGYPFILQWESSDYSIIYSDGVVENKELEGEETIRLTLTLKRDEYEVSEDFFVIVYPYPYTEDELYELAVLEELKEKEKDSRTDEIFLLPSMVLGQEITYKEIISDSSMLVLLLAVVFGLLVYVLKDIDLHKKVEERDKELLTDYSTLVSKLAMYLGAGMSVRNIFFKLSEDGAKNKNSHYVYKEIEMMCNEMCNGVLELDAIEHFGKRCHLPQYTKLCSILTQNIRRGGLALLSLLQEEAQTAFETRKNQARKLGEEASTKLLLPMMLMLCVVMLIILAPAFMNIGI